LKTHETKLKASRMALEKNFPGAAAVASTIRNTANSISRYSQDLGKDRTITVTERRRRLAKFTSKAHKSAFDVIFRRSHELVEKIERLEGKINHKLLPAGGVDSLILLQTANVLRELPIKDAFLAAESSLDAARAMATSPICHAAHKTGTDEMQARLKKLIEYHVLEPKERDQLTAYRDEVSTLTKALDATAALQAEADSAAKQIESMMAKEPSLEPAA